MPESDTKGISRKIEQESTRKKLKQAMNSMDLPENIGYIVRTAGIGQKKTELKRDVDYLIRVYEKICERGKQVKAPALVYKESNLVIRLIRDYFSPDIDEVLVDDPKVAQEGKDFFQEVMPEYAQLVKLHQERRPIFSRYQIEEQIEALHRNKVPLPSGGSIVIDSTEALVAIDVNSGKMATEKGVEGTAFKSNMEAAAEAARQLRLRDLGGLIVIDFIDMRDRKHIRDVEKCLKDALKNDKARVSVSQFGLLEMSRQRIKAALAEASYLPCPHCEGSGRIKSAEAQALNFVRRLSAGMAKGQIGRVEGQVPPDVADYLQNNKRAELSRLEQQYNATIYVKGCAELTNGQLEVEFFRREKEEQKSIQNYVEASSGRAEIPVEAAVSEEPAAEAETEAAGDASPRPSGRKRRRPRRRRKPAEAAEAAADQATETSDLQDREPETTQPAVDQREILGSPAATAPADKADVAADPINSSFTPTVRPATETQKTEQIPPQPSAGEPATPVAEEQTTAKPKPRRRRPTAARKTAQTETTADATGEPATEPAAEPAAEPAEPKTTEEVTPAPAAETPRPKAPRRRRPPAAKKTSDTEQPAQAAPPAGAVEAPKDDKDQTGEKPKRRRTRKPAAKKPTTEAAEQSLPTATATVESSKTVSEQSESVADEPKKKPARRGRPRKKPAAEDPATAAEESPKDSETDAE
jgi:ribonuclease E